MRTWLRVVILPLMLMAALVATGRVLRTDLPPALAVLLVYLGMMPVVAGLERWIPRYTSWNRRHDDFGTDALYLPMTWGVGALLGPVFAAAAVAVGGLLSRSWGAELWPAAWSVPAQVALACVVAEFFDYWGHRLMHQIPALWRFHAIHHSARRVYWLNATRTHPGETLVRGLFGGIPLAALGVAEPVLAWWMVLGRVAGLFQHANIDFALGPFGWIFSIGDLHRWHHSRARHEADRNYGNSFIFWDGVFGTRYLPADREPPEEVGLEGDAAFPTGILGQVGATWRRATWRRPT